MKLKQICSFIFVIICLFCSFPALSNSILGGEITWNQLGKDSFMITLTLYRDCNGNAFGNQQVLVKCQTTGSTLDTLTFSAVNGVDITPLCKTSCSRCDSSNCSFIYGVQKYEYKQLLVINNAGSCCKILLAYSQCCRPSTITTGAASTNFYTEAIFNRCIQGANSSPNFTNMPIIIICIGQDFIFNQGVANDDADSNGSLLDSLSFEWTNPLNASGSYVSYSGQYTYEKPIFFWGFSNVYLPFPRGFHLDRNTGDISFRPMKIEQTVMAIKITEWRKINGVRTNTGTSRRDYQAIVISCPNNNAPVLSGPFYKEVCAGDTVTFSISTNDYDTRDTLTISWDGAIKDAVWTDNNGKVKHPTGKLVWVPKANQAGSLPYVFTVNVTDNACPVNGSTTRAYQISVNTKPKTPAFHDTLLYCTEIKLDAIMPLPYHTYYWEIGDNPIVKKTGTTVNYITPKPGNFPVKLMARTSCGYSAPFMDTITVDTFLLLSPMKDTSVCLGTENKFISNYENNKGKVSFLWSTGDRTQSVNIKSLANQNIHIIATDSFGCKAYDTFRIFTFYDTSMVRPKLGISSLCYGSILSLSAKNYPGATYSWSTGDTSKSISFPALSSQSVILTIIDSTGCHAKDTASIFVTPSNHFTLGPDVFRCFHEDITLNPDLPNFTLNDTIRYFNLSKGTLIASGKKSITLTEAGIYACIVNDRHSCIFSDTIQLFKHAEINAFAADINTCYKDTVLFVADSTGSKSVDVKYEWYDAVTGNLLSDKQIFLPIALKSNAFLLKVSELYHGRYCTDEKTIKLSTKFPTIKMNLPVKLCAQDMDIDLSQFKNSTSGSFYAYHPSVTNGYLYNPSKSHSNYDQLLIRLTDNPTSCIFDTSISIQLIGLPAINIYNEYGKYSFCPEYGKIQLYASPAGGFYGGKWYGPVDDSNYFNADTIPGTYVLIYEYKGGNGCFNRDSMILTVGYTTISIDKSDTVICTGQHFPSIANYTFAQKMQWIYGLGSDGFMNGSIYNVQNTYVTGDGDKLNKGFTLYAKTIDPVCPETWDSIQVYIAAQPKADFSADMLTGNPPLNVQFSDQTNIAYDYISDYLWDFGDGNQSTQPDPFHTYADTGWYGVSLKVISPYGCSDSVGKKKLIYVYPLSMDENEGSKINVYPNPAQDQVIIESSESMKKVVLYNFLGAKIREMEVNENKVTLNRDKLPAGLYLLKVYDKKGEVYVFQVVFK